MFDMANRIKISSLGQSPPLFSCEENSRSNTDLIARMIDFWKDQIDMALADQPDIIVLPETCDDYFRMPAEARTAYREARGDSVLHEFQKIARDNSCYIIYPSVRPAFGDAQHNAILVIDRAGDVIGQYNKTHPTLAEIDEGVMPGNGPLILQCDFGALGFAICFDLNFDELRLRYQANPPDLMVFCSMFHGDLLQASWAHGCRAHFVSSVWHHTPNEIYSPLGQRVACSTGSPLSFSGVTATVNLDCAVVHLDYHRGKLIALKKKYGSGVSVYYADKLDCALITSEQDAVSAADMLREFDIELLDSYLGRALERHHELAG